MLMRDSTHENSMNDIVSWVSFSYNIVDERKITRNVVYKFSTIMHRSLSANCLALLDKLRAYECAKKGT